MSEVLDGFWTCLLIEDLYVVSSVTQYSEQAPNRPEHLLDSNLTQRSTKQKDPESEFLFLN